MDVILEQSQVDTGRIALAGAGLGGTLALAAAAFRPQVVAIAVDTPIMIGVPGVLDLAGAYPLEEVKDFLRTYPDRSDGVLSGLGLFSRLPWPAWWTARLCSVPEHETVASALLLSGGDSWRG